MYLLCLTGLLGIAITGDAFNVFVFLEISSLSSYVLISLGRDRRALTAAFQYLIMGTLGATFYPDRRRPALHAMTGTLNMATWPSGCRRSPNPHGRGRLRLPHRRHRPQAGAVPAASLAAQRLLLCALGSDRFLAATATKVSVYVLILRCLFHGLRRLSPIRHASGNERRPCWRWPHAVRWPRSGWSRYSRPT